MISSHVSALYLLRRKNKPLKNAYRMLGPGATSSKFHELLELKTSTDKKAFAYYLRMLMQTDTSRCSIDDMKKLYEGLTRHDLMRRKELKKFKCLPEKITIWRGTVNSEEWQPRMSWSLNEKVARMYARAHLFKAVIPKSDVIAYYCDDTFEDEIVAYVPKENVEMQY